MKSFFIKVVVQINVDEKILVFLWPLIKDVLENKFVFLLEFLDADGYTGAELHAVLQLVESNLSVELEVYFKISLLVDHPVLD